MNILALGDIVTSEWATSFGKELEQSTWRGAGALKSVLPCATIVAICQKAAAVLHKEPTLLEVRVLSNLYILPVLLVSRWQRQGRTESSVS